MKLQQDPLSMTKPDNLPNMDIIKEKAQPKIPSGIPKADGMFTPSFVKPTISNRVIFRYVFITLVDIQNLYSGPERGFGIFFNQNQFFFRDRLPTEPTVVRKSHVQDHNQVDKIRGF